MTAITNPPPPKDFIITEVIKLRRGGFTIVFNDKEAIKWLQDEGAELEFTSGIAPDASITKCVYSILVPRVPLTFNPTDNKHLREVEESNNLPCHERTYSPLSGRSYGPGVADSLGSDWLPCVTSLLSCVLLIESSSLPRIVPVRRRLLLLIT